MPADSNSALSPIDADLLKARFNVVEAQQDCIAQSIEPFEEQLVSTGALKNETEFRRSPAPSPPPMES